MSGYLYYLYAYQQKFKSKLISTFLSQYHYSDKQKIQRKDIKSQQSIQASQTSYSIYGRFCCNLNMLSTTWISVAVDSSPQKAAQSLTASPAPMTSLPRLMVPAHRGTWSKFDSQSSCSTVVWGCTNPPLLLRTQQVPTSMLLAIELRNTSTPSVSLMISSVSLSRSGWMSATQSLQAMQFPRADSFSSTRTTFTLSLRLFRMFLSSLSVVLLGTRRPFLFPAVVRPTMRVPPMVVWMTGMKEPSSLQNTLQKLQEPPDATRQQPLVSLVNTPMSLEFSYWTRFAIPFLILCLNIIVISNQPAINIRLVSTSRMPRYSWQQIGKHASQQDCWIVISKKVLNVTPFLKQHPGGRWIILEWAGRDGTAAFERTTHSEVALEKMYELYIGDVEQG